MFFKKPLHPTTKTGKSNVSFNRPQVECSRSPSVSHISEIRNKHPSLGSARLGKALTREFSCEDQVLTANMGGELGDFISRLSGSSYNCIGTMPIHRETVTTWYGYPHSGGIPDSSGKRWWAYQKCKISGYQTSWWKVERLLLPKNDVDKADSSRKSGEKQNSKRITFDDHKDYYRLLCVEPDADQEQIQKNYRYLVMRFHPDLSTAGKENDMEIMKSLNEAHEVLSDPQARSQYDRDNNRKG